MSTRPPGGAETWGGRPVARTAATAEPRGRVTLSGRLLGVECHHRPGPCVEAILDDGTGRLGLRWMGRRAVPGIVAGALVSVEGTVVEERGRPVLLNPIYEFCGPAGDGSSGSPPTS
jgi:hypothetical protein